MMIGEVMADADSAREEWLKARKSGIGGSDAAAALGLSPWKTPYALWEEKTGRASDTEPTERMDWGNRLESIIAAVYAKERGFVLDKPGMIAHPDYPWMLASVDYHVRSINMGVEVKNVSYESAHFGHAWGEPGTDEIPVYYMLQVQHYMAVAGYDSMDLVALVGGNEMRVYHIPRNADLIALLISQERLFWNCVENDTAPGLSTPAETAARFPTSTVNRVVATAEVVDAWLRLRSLKATADLHAADENTLKTIVQEAMGDADTLVDTNGTVLATWKSSKAVERFDKRLLSIEEPDVYSRYVETVPGPRRFLLKP